MADEFERLRDALAGHYDVERVLGQGGMAVVYLARDLKHGRAVAIKVLKPELSATMGAERFLREIRVAAQLQHSGILGLYDSGVADGLLYYVMPFVEGESLGARIERERQLPLEDATRLIREAADALQYAHDRAIVHRDIKPENILLQRGHALVADFGIAKAVEAATGQKLTETGMALGTPRYMSPEQALGGELDGRSDQYSLGCVLYEALVGQPPFDGPNPMALLARHAMEQVPSMRVVRPSIPDQLEDVTMQALAKAPEDRFARIGDMAELLGQLESALALERTSGRRAAATPRTPMPSAIGISRTPRTPMPRATGARTPPVTAVPTMKVPAEASLSRHKRFGVMAGVVIVALLLAGGWAWSERSARVARVAATSGGADPRRIAVLYFDDRSPDHHLAPLTDGLTEDLIRSLSTVQGLEVVSQNGVAAFRNPGLPRDSVARALRAGTLVLGQVEPGDKGTIRLTLRLVDGSGSEFKKVTLDEPASDPLAMRTALTARVSDVLRERLGEEVRTRAERSMAQSADAWVVLQRAEQQRKAAETAASAGEALEAGRHFVSADSLAVVAAAGDPAWNAPLVFRGRIAYRRSRLAVNNPLAADPYIAAGLALADTVLARDPADPDALELRGNLRYWRWLLRLEPDKTASQALLDGARADLEASTRLAPLQAGAWGSLSHLYYQTGNTTDVLLAARKAYEADAYLENAGTILDRLFTASYDLEQAVDASQWCAEGLRRFPGDARFQLCQLYLMTMPGQKPDVAKAWHIAASDALRSDPSTGSPEFQVREARMVVAAILGRAGLRDSARTVIAGSRASADIDPTKDLYHDEAFAQLQVGDTPAALSALKIYMAANPDAREGLAQDPGWWFRPIANDPGFKAAVGAH